MTPKEKQMLDELFQKLRQMEIDSAPRSEEADSLLRDSLRQQPAAPYYMAQLLLLQKDALANAKARIDALETQLEEQSENQAKNQTNTQSSSNQADLAHPPQYTEQPTYNRRSFLEGAAQTALGIGGGLLLADFVTGLFDAAIGDDGSDESEQDVAHNDFDLFHTSDEADTSDAGGSFGLRRLRPLQL